MDFFVPHVVLQLCMLAMIAYGTYLLTYKNDMRTYKEKKREIITGIILVSIGSIVIFSIWLIFFITYKQPIQLYTSNTTNLGTSKIASPLK